MYIIFNQVYPKGDGDTDNSKIELIKYKGSDFMTFWQVFAMSLVIGVSGLIIAHFYNERKNKGRNEPH